MATLLDYFGFDGSTDHADYNTKFPVWNGGSISLTFGRNGTYGLGVGGVNDQWCYLVPGVRTEIGVNLAVKATALTYPLLRFYGVNPGVAANIEVRTTGTGEIEVRRGATVLGISTLGAGINTTVHIPLSIYVVIHDTLGAVEVRRSDTGVVLLALTNIDTNNGYATNQIGYVSIESATGSSTVHVDDIVFWEKAGATFPAFPGDLVVSGVLPTGVGDTTGFAPLAGANWQNADDVPTVVHGDVDYNSSSTDGATDTFAMADYNFTAQVYALKLRVMAKKLLGGDGSLAPVIRPGGTDRLGTDTQLGTTYHPVEDIWVTNPDTGAAWANILDVNGVKAGYRRNP